MKMKVYVAVVLALAACAHAHVPVAHAPAYYRALSPFVLARSYASPAPAPSIYSYYSAPASTSHAYTISHYQPASWSSRLYPHVFSSVPVPYLNLPRLQPVISFVHQIPQSVTSTVIDQQQYLPSPSNDISNDGFNVDTSSVGSAAQGPELTLTPQPDEENFDQTTIEVEQEKQEQNFPSQEVPLQQFPVQQFPLQNVPVQQFPVQQFPSQQFPPHLFPSQQFPLQQFPSQQFPTQQLPGQQIPAQHVPAQEVPAQQFPPQDTSPSQQPNTESIFGGNNPSEPESNDEDTITVEAA